MTLPGSKNLLRRTKAFLLFGIIFSSIGSCSSDREPDEIVSPPPVEVTLPAGVYRIAGITPTNANADLEPFRAIVGNTKFVALGESTHMSRGYYQAKVRLIRFMVEQMGYRVIALETPWLQAEVASRYVATCTGSPEAAVATFYRVWQDETVFNLLRWMCEYNRAHPTDRVTFFGFDIQEPWKSAPALKQFVQIAAPAEVGRTTRLDRCLGATHGSDQFFVSQEYRDHAEGRRNTAAHEECLRGITEMESWIAGNGSALAAATSAAILEEARLSLVSLRSWQNTLWVPDPGGYQSRDSGMAQLVQRLAALRAPGKKTIIWAWNWHIARRYEEVRGFDDDPLQVVPRQTARAMGSFLHDALGSDYLPIALIGYRVDITIGFSSPPLQTNPLSVERRLHDLGQPYLLVDLRQSIPALFSAGQVWKVSQEWGDPYRQFGALLFLDESGRMAFLPPA